MISYKSIILLLVVGESLPTAFCLQAFCSIAFDGIHAIDMQSDSHETRAFALGAGADTTLKIYGLQDLRTHQCVVSILAVGGGGGGNPTPMPSFPVGGGGSGYVKFVDNIVLSSAVHFVRVSVGTQGSSSIIEIDGREIRAEPGHDREGFSS